MRDSMTTLRAAAQQALEALEHSLTFVVIEAKRAVRNDCADATIREAETAEHQHRVAITDLRAALAEPVQEPIGWFGYDKSIGTWFETNEGDDDSVPLYATPPQRKPLTEEEIQELSQQHKFDSRMEKFVRIIERAHGIGGQE